MFMGKVILSIDCGTQSMRALLFTHKGSLLNKVQIEYPPYVSQKPGWSEQDPEVYWQSLCRVCRILKEKEPKHFAEIAGVGVTTFRDSYVNVDENGKVLRPVVSWMDQRKAKPVYFPNGLMKIFYKTIGMEEAIKKIQVEAKSNWIIQNQPGVWKKTYKFLQVSGFINFRLTGNFTDSIASQVGHIPFNYKKMRWSKKNTLNSRLFPIKREKLPDIVQPGQQIGHISRQASSETGIVFGVPVIACGSDKGCETIGMGVINEKTASVSFGTAASVQTTAKKYYEPIRFMPPYPAAVPGYYNPEVQIFRGCWMITWFKNEFAYKEVLAAGRKNLITEVILNDLLDKVPPGSYGLMVQPFWGPGLKQPEAKGAMIGFGDVHTKAHVYRAIIEGLGFALYEGLQQIEKAGRIKFHTVAVSGGASQSDEICRITADLFNLPIVRGETFETSGLGAAIITAVGVGLYSSFDNAIENMVTYETTFVPDRKNADIYRQLYQKVYKEMYPSLKSLYEEIREITGYPEK